MMARALLFIVFLLLTFLGPILTGIAYLEGLPECLQFWALGVQLFVAGIVAWFAAKGIKP